MAMDPTVSELMDLSSDIELKVAEIYDAFSIVFEDNTEQAQFWALFAEAERYHSMILQLQKHMFTVHSATPKQCETWRKDVGEMLEFLVSTLQRLRAGEWRPSVEEAFSLADHIENQVAEAQTHSFKMVDESEAGELVARLHQDDLDHRHKLAEARRRFDPDLIDEARVH